MNIMDLENLKSWDMVTRGIFRYVTASKVCYEIHVLYHEEDTDIKNAKASLFLVGQWYGGGKSFFERECLLAEKQLLECLVAARKDYADHVLED